MIPIVHYDPISLQNEGFRLAAAGQLREALTVFDKAVAESEGKNASLITVDTAVTNELQRYKLVFMFEGGMAAARNNRGVLRFLTGDLAGAQEDLDYAAVAAPDASVPWINAALVLLAQSRFPRAEVSAQGAVLRGADNARARAVLAETNLALGRVSLAREDAEKAVKLAATDPYGLYVLALALRASGRGREADRTLVQAISLEPRSAVGSPLAPVTGMVSGLGGNASEQHGGFHASGPTFRVRGQRIQQQVEGRDNAQQADEYIEATFGAPDGKWAGYAVSHRSAGGRPGSLFGSGGTQPNATFRLDQQKLSLVRHDKKLSFHVGYQDDAVVSRLNSGANPTWPVQDQRTIAETRFLDKRVNAGFSWSQNWRKSQGTGLNFATSSPIEPAEQVLPSGRWSQSVGWAFLTKSLNSRMQLTAGPVAVLTRRATVVQPFVDLAIQGLTPKPSHFRILPRVAEAGGDFFPQAARAETPQDNTIDRHEETGQALNRTPILAGPEGRIVESSFALPQQVGKAELETKLFHRRMQGVFAQSADPRVATGLILTPVSHAESSGIQQTLRWTVAKGVIGRVGVRYQEAYGRIPGLVQGSGGPTAGQVAVRGLANFPRWQGSGRLDTTLGDWSVGSEVQVVGRRAFWQTVGSGRSQLTTVGQVRETLGLNLYLKRHIPNLGEFSLSVFNLTSASFYPGYPGAVTGVSGFSWRF